MTLRQRPTSSHWWYDFWYRGRRYRGSTRFKSKLRAREYERRLIQELEAGRNPFFRSAPLQDLLPQYLAWLEVNRSAQHVERSRRAIANVLKRMPRAAVSDDITPSKIEDFKRRRLKEVSASTVNLELRHFKAFLKRCVKQGWLNRVPVDIEKVKTPSRGRLVFLSEGEIEPFLNKLKPWSREAARLMLLTGLRLDEARFLEWQDIDIETGELWLRNKPELGFSPKNGKERVVALPPELIEELQLRQQKSGWVLQGEKGGQVDKWTFHRAVVMAGRKAGLSKRITPHVLRHTYGSHLVMNGVDIQTVKDLMGHSSITTTAIYLHTDPKHRREAVAKLKLPVGKEAEEKVIPLRG